MTESRAIKLSPVYRILAGLICLLASAGFIHDPDFALEYLRDDFMSRLSVMLVLPLFLSCSIRGKVPDFITRNVDEEMFEDMLHAEKLFTRFNAKSCTAALVFFPMVFYTIYKHW